MLAAFAGTGITTTHASEKNSPGAVYVLSNAAAGNSVLLFDRASNGALTPAGSVATGGLGTGSGLGSQGSLSLSNNNRWLFAVNAGSNDISAFKVTRDGLQLTDKISSGGIRPISLTTSGDLLYVLNAEPGANNITGFMVRDGRFEAIPNSTRPLSGSDVGPAQVQFNAHGDLLAVTEKGTNRIDTYVVNHQGLASAPHVQAAAGTTPFGFAFDQRNRLFVSEAFGGAAGASAVSSYKAEENGSLEVLTPSSATHQTAACWVAVTNNGRYAYTTNAGSGSVSGYRIDHNGEINLLNADGRTGVTGDGSSPTDVTTDNSSRNLYVLTSGSHTIVSFNINGNGSLTPIAGAPSLPASAIGIAAR